MNEVYAICMSCGHSSLIELPDWDKSLPECPYCDRSMVDGDTPMKNLDWADGTMIDRIVEGDLKAITRMFLILIIMGFLLGMWASLLIRAVLEGWMPW